MSGFTLESVREWKLDGVNLPVYLGKPGFQPLIPIQDAMQLVYESKNSKENLSYLSLGGTTPLPVIVEMKVYRDSLLKM